MDTKILYVTSDIDSTKCRENNDLVSFHRQPVMFMNAKVLSNMGVHAGMYARYTEVDFNARYVVIEIRYDKPLTNPITTEKNKSRWYKITNPRINTRNRYCCIRTTDLLYNFGLLLYGAFDYMYEVIHKDDTVGRLTIFF